MTFNRVETGSKKTRTTQIRWSDSEYQIALENAQSRGLSFSEYLRSCALKRRTANNDSRLLVAGLVQFASTITASESKDRISPEETDELLGLIKRAIRAIGEERR